MSIRTAVFVDGYNLYYGRLRGTAYKWLDLVKFSNQLLANRTQNEILTRVCFCTAHASGTFATHGTNSVESQASYHRALQALHGEQIEIIYGEHSWDKSGTSMPMFEKIEEKQTDVNLALAMYRECAKGLCDRIIVMSNDRDIVPALIAIKADFPHIVCGIIFPLKPSIGTATNRRKSGSLEQIADWKIDSISDDTLTLAQMPAKVPVAGKKTIIKPSYW
jgi:uncharacterized LabA/DUF88 family protein